MKHQNTTLANEQDAGNEIFDLVIQYSETVEDASWKVYGLKAWFDAFLVSNEFAKMTAQSRKDAVELFGSLSHFLKALDGIQAEHQVGNYCEAEFA